MFKPLLRVLPSLSGNLKLACNLLDYTESTNDDGESVYETNIRYAKLYPISSVSWNKKIDAGLLGSSWEYDVKKFYDTYSDTFYKDEFSYDKSEMAVLDKTKEFKPRNTDFEYGVKRISYQKNGNQFACFAPIYIDSVDDIPGYFLLNVKLNNGSYVINKKIKINIGNNGSDRYNYLTTYLKKYVSQIDNKVIFCLPKSKQAAYYGIDVQHGGFAKCLDNAISILYTNQNTIQNFDAMICNGFKRNKLIMKQIIPLAFYFDLSDILTDRERYHYRNSQVYFSGNYYTADDKKIDFYDFAVDYDNFMTPILRMNKEYGTMNWQAGDVDNIMDVGFPSLNEGRYINYQFANKLSPNFTRWKMLYSDDDTPYVMNMSWAFSKNQNSNYKYGEFPISFYQMTGLADYQLFDGEYQYNLHFPLSVDKEKIYDPYDKTLAINYESIFNDYSLSWYTLITEYNDSVFSNNDLWRNVDNNCIYYNGILYDLSNIYNLIDGEKIDKFAVFIVPDLDILSWDEITSLKFSDYTLFRESSSNVTNANAVANDSILYSGLVDKDPANYLYYKEAWDYQKVYSDELQFNNIFTYSYGDGNYVDINEISYNNSYIDYYDVNKYYDATTILSVLSEVKQDIIEDSKSGSVDNKVLASMVLSYLDELNSYEDYVINSYLQIPIYAAASLAYDPTPVEEDNTAYNAYVKELNILRYEGKITETQYYEYLNTAKSAYLHPADNSYILNLAYYSDYLRDHLFYHTRDEVANTFSYSYNNGGFIFEDKHYAYMRAGEPKFMNTLYGNTFYVSHDFYKASTISEFKNPISYEYLQSYCISYRAKEIAIYGVSYWDYSDIYNPINYDNGDMYTGNIAYATAYSAYLYRALNNYKDIAVRDNTEEKLAEHDLTEYTFNPVLQYNGENYVSDVFTELLPNTGKYGGDLIKSKYVLNDKNVLWVDEYNLNSLYRKFLPDVKPPVPQFNSYTSYNFYANFLNKIHIYYYFVELFKNAEYGYGENEFVNCIMVDKYTDEYGETYIDGYLHQEEYEGDDDGLIRIETDLNYDDWFEKDWYANIFVKSKILLDKQDNEKMKTTHPTVKYAYKLIKNDYKDRFGHDFDSFIEWYSDLNYDEETKMFYYTNHQNKPFELVFKKRFYRVDSNIWKITHMEEIMSETATEDEYKDLYFYRLQKPHEWDDKFKGVSFVTYEKDAVKLLDNGVKIEDTDTCLVPMFDSIFTQDAEDAEIFTHVQLHDITITWNEHENTNNYRYNSNNKLYMIEITDEEKARYGFTKTYTKYENTSSTLLGKENCLCDDLGYGDLNLNTKVTSDGTKYGFYIIKCKINNTSDTFRVYGVEDDVITAKVKYLYYINNINIYNNPNYLKSVFTQIVPFTRLKPLDEMQNVNTIIYPNSYNIDLHYKQYIYNIDNGSNEVDILRYNQIIKRMLLQRYMHDMTPLIKKTSTVGDQYSLKLKNVKGGLLVDKRYNSIGDSVIYSKAEHINTFKPYNVYSTSFDDTVKNYNNVVEEYTPIEYKHYNASCMVYLEPLIEIKAVGKYTYEQLLTKQTSEETFNIFKNYVNKTQNSKWDDASLLFLLNKYKVEYDTTPVGLNIGKTDKVFTLTYRFKLL